MVNREEIIFNEPLYFVPDYSGPTKVSVLRLFDDGEALVKQCCRKRGIKPFTRPMTFIYDNCKDAKRGGRAWESYVRRQKKESKNGRSG